MLWLLWLTFWLTAMLPLLSLREMPGTVTARWVRWCTTGVGKAARVCVLLRSADRARACVGRTGRAAAAVAVEGAVGVATAGAAGGRERGRDLPGAPEPVTRAARAETGRLAWP